MRDEFRMTIERHSADGEWEELGTVMLDDHDRWQLALLLSGIDIEGYAQLPATAQERVLKDLANARQPHASLN